MGLLGVFKMGSIRIKGGPTMRIVEKLLYGISGLLGLILLFILLCHFNPNIAKKLGEVVLANAKETEQEAENKVQDTFDATTATDGLAVLPISAQEYVAPTEDQLVVPAWADEKNGLTAVQAQGTEITQDEATKAYEKLGIGKDGKGLDFDATMYPYYHMLDATGKTIYRQIYANAKDMITDFAPIEDISATLLKNAFTAVVNDHPELFWVNTEYEYQYAPTGRIAAIYLSFNKTAKKIEEATKLFEDAAATILEGADALGSDYEKEVYVHDQLISKVSYSKQASMNQSAYSAMVLGKTVCAGYARAFQYLMQKLGIPCYYCTGFAGERHAWNIIKLGDDYYNVDTTWDDTNPSTYVYFNCSDADYAKNHIRRDLSVKLPPCNGEKYRRLEIEEEEEDTNTETTTSPTTNTTTGQQQVVTVMRSLESTGFEYEDLLWSAKEYYAECSSQLVGNTKKKFTFQCVVADGDIWEDIIKGYEDESYLSAYMNRVLAEKHLSGSDVTVTGEALSDGSYLLTHTITLW